MNLFERLEAIFGEGRNTPNSLRGGLSEGESVAMKMSSRWCLASAGRLEEVCEADEGLRVVLMGILCSEKLIWLMGLTSKLLWQDKGASLWDYSGK